MSATVSGEEISRRRKGRPSVVFSHLPHVHPVGGLPHEPVVLHRLLPAHQLAVRPDPVAEVGLGGRDGSELRDPGHPEAASHPLDPAWATRPGPWRPGMEPGPGTEREGRIRIGRPKRCGERAREHRADIMFLQNGGRILR